MLIFVLLYLLLNGLQIDRGKHDLKIVGDIEDLGVDRGAEGPRSFMSFQFFYYLCSLIDFFLFSQRDTLLHHRALLWGLRLPSLLLCVLLFGRSHLSGMRELPHC